MKIVILTTQTYHHAYFVEQIHKEYPIHSVLVETRSIKPPFNTHHPFEDVRDKYESDTWFCGRGMQISSLAKTIFVGSINDASAVAFLKESAPDVVIAFGTRKILPSLLKTCPTGMINLHGGDPEYYRGLDCQLWAIYHDDYGGLIVTLHTINEVLDDGDIILQKAIVFNPETEIYMLRKLTTEICVEMTISAMDMYKRFKNFIARPQRRLGRYYSFMPSELKTICIKKFENYLKRYHATSKQT